MEIPEEKSPAMGLFSFRYFSQFIQEIKKAAPPHKFLSVRRTVKIDKSGFTPDAFLRDQGNALDRRSKFTVIFDDLFCPLLNGILGQGRNILKMIIKGIPVYLTVFYNVLYRNFVVGPLFEKLPECVTDRLFVRFIAAPPKW